MCIDVMMIKSYDMTTKSDSSHVEEEATKAMMSVESLASTLEKTPKTPKDADPWKAHKILAKFVLYRLSPNLSKVVLRRLVSGPKLPSWPFLFEVVMEAVGAQIKSNPISDIVHLTEQVDSLIIPLPKEKYQVAKVNAGGVSALWIACRDVTKRMNFSALAGKSSVKAPASS